MGPTSSRGPLAHPAHADALGGVGVNVQRAVNVSEPIGFLKPYRVCREGCASDRTAVGRRCVAHALLPRCMNPALETITDKFGPKPPKPTRRRSLSTRTHPRRGRASLTSPRRPLTPNARNLVRDPDAPRLGTCPSSPSWTRPTPCGPLPTRNAVTTLLPHLDPDAPRLPTPTDDTLSPRFRPMRDRLRRRPLHPFPLTYA